MSHSAQACPDWVLPLGFTRNRSGRLGQGELSRELIIYQRAGHHSDNLAYQRRSDSFADTGVLVREKDNDQVRLGVGDAAIDPASFAQVVTLVLPAVRRHYGTRFHRLPEVPAERLRTALLSTVVSKASITEPPVSTMPRKTGLLSAGSPG